LAGTSASYLRDQLQALGYLFAIKFLHAFWRLCAQQIAASELAPVNHSAQVLADRAGVPADVRIGKLRRIERRPTDGTKPVEVRGRSAGRGVARKGAQWRALT
jgi:hypothetical protein